MLYGILVATGASDRSADPARRAAMLAAAHSSNSSGKLELLSVATARAPGQPAWWQARNRLMHQAARLRKAFGVRCTALLGAGSLAAEVMARIEATEPGLVVLGWHAPSWLGRLRKAWTLARIVQRSRRPVLVVRNAALRPYARVLAASDFADDELHVARAALRCAPGAHLTLLHALDTGIDGTMRRVGVTDAAIEQHRRERRRTAQAAFEGFVEKLGLPAQRVSLVLTLHPQRAGLRLHAEFARPDLIVLGEGGLLSCLPGMSAVRELLADTACDVLVVPPPAQDAATGLARRRGRPLTA